MAEGLTRGPLTDCVHLCVDMQRLFAEETDWHTPWMGRVLPHVTSLVAHRPADTIFTRFIPAARPGEGEGTWKAYYERWASMTLERLPPGMTDLVPELARFAPPAEVVDKTVYSPWLQPDLAASLRRRGARALIVSGGETDVCVLATVLGAVDLGFRVIVAGDCLCSSDDDTHDALVAVYKSRYGQQVEVADTAELLAGWR